jgi:hypothetical protein
VISLLYGQPGTGKSTLATGMILDNMRNGFRTVANFPVDASPAVIRPSGKISQAHVEVLPARPSFAQLQAIGSGWSDPKDIGREDRSGLLVMDEIGGWINSRNWNDKERQQIIDWFLHSRKRGWNIVFIAQHPNLVDKQVREAVVEGYARIRRTDRMKLPLIGVSLPRFHIAIHKYGMDQNSPRLNTWVYRGTTEHKCFQSYVVFDSDDDVIQGSYCTLPARITKWHGQVTWKGFRKAQKRISEQRPPPKQKSGWILKLQQIKCYEQRLYHFRKLQSFGLV